PSAGWPSRPPRSTSSVPDSSNRRRLPPAAPASDHGPRPLPCDTLLRARRAGLPPALVAVKLNRGSRPAFVVAGRGEEPMSDMDLHDGSVNGNRSRFRPPARVVTSLCLLIALVGTACGGRASKNERAAAKAPAPAVQPAAPA